MIKILMKEKGEERIKQEDCSEDTFGSGILTLTNRRIAFDKSKGRIMDFSKKFDDTVIDISLGEVFKIWKEGWLMKKICVSTKQDGQEKIYKFGVFGTRGWLYDIKDAMDEYDNENQ